MFIAKIEMQTLKIGRIDYFCISQKIFGDLKTHNNKIIVRFGRTTLLLGGSVQKLCVRRRRDFTQRVPIDQATSVPKLFLNTDRKKYKRNNY